MKETKETQEREHHPYSPSQLPMLQLCRAFVSEQRTSPEAQRGTELHEATADEAGPAEHHSDYDAEQVTAVKMAEDYWIKTIFKGEQNLEDYREIKINVPVSLPLDSATFGYADRVLISKKQSTALLFDYKYGRHLVPATSLQFAAYAVGLLQQFKTIKQVVVVVLQPHAGLAPHDSQPVVYTRKALPEWEKTLYQILTEAKKARTLAEKGDFSKARPNFKTCLFCKFLPKCTAVVEALEKTELPVPDEVTEWGPSLKNITFTDPSKLSQVLKFVNLVKTWAEAVRGSITQAVLAGEAPVPTGYQLVTQEKRKVTDSRRFIQFATNFIEKEKLFEACAVQISKVVALLREQAPRGQKDAYVNDVLGRAEEAGLITKGDPITFLKLGGA
jgi:hypothetical protein